MSEELSKQKRTRAGHRGSAKRIISQAQETIDSGEINVSKLSQYLKTLKEKVETLRNLDAKILEAMEDGDELITEIEQADLNREVIELAILDIEAALQLGEGRKSADRPTQATLNDAERASSNVTSSPQVNDTTHLHSDAVVEPASASPLDEVLTVHHQKARLPKLELKRFEGELTTWTSFWDSFEAAIHNNEQLSSIDKFNYLRTLLEGPAAAAVAGLSLTSSNYTEAVAVLKKRFGNKQLIISAHMDMLMNLEGVSSGQNLKAIRELHNDVESHVRSLQSLGVPSSSFGAMLASVIMNKLPHDLRLAVSKEITDGEWDLKKVMAVVEKEIDARERAAANAKPVLRGMGRSHQPTASALLSSSGSPSCSFCGQPHFSANCKTVADVRERKQLLSKNGRCFACLRKGHMSKDCRSSKNCHGCGGRHHASICPKGKQQLQGSSASTGSQQSGPNASSRSRSNAGGGQQSSISLVVSTKVPTLLQTARVKVRAPGKLAPVIETRILLDTGSQRSYISRQLSEALGLKEEKRETLLVKAFAAEEEKLQVCSVVSLRVETRAGSSIVLSLLAIPIICGPITGQPITCAMDLFPHLSGLELADSGDLNECLEIGILIGADQYWEVVTGEIVRGRSGPSAMKTCFGWVLSGPVPGVIAESQVTCSNISHVLTTQTHSSQQELVHLEKKLQAFWDLDTLGIKEGEQSVYQKFVEDVSFRGGRYCVRLPWKFPRIMLPDNQELCQRRLYNLLRRLQQSPQILAQYNEIIQDQLRQGIVEIVDPSDAGSIGATHYLPHHAVIREDKLTTKLRIVYDASARSNGPSLNDSLYAGPTFGQNILDILLRFRLFQIAVTADLEKAFLMVSVAEEDRNALRFLWVDDIAAQLPRLVVMRFTRVVFGVSASPFLLNATIRKHVEGYRDRDHSFVEKFNRSIYVDDLTFGGKTEAEAFELYEKSKRCLSQAGFILRKFMSNSPALQARVSSQETNEIQVPQREAVTCDDESYTKNTLGERLELPECVKVLGVKWKPTEDILVCDIGDLYKVAVNMVPTKRNVIGLSARVYDPMGILSPWTVCFKLLFQDICAAKLDWDDQLEGEVLLKWKMLLSRMKEPLLLQIPRCYFHGVEEPHSCELVGFCDASQRAYAAVVFMKIGSAGKGAVRFVASRTRVAPMNSLTIPRLELLAALLLARLLSNTMQALQPEQKFKKATCYTDSKIVLYWIRGYDKEWKQFVENRVREIRTLIPVECWHHCRGDVNPADLPSRGVEGTEPSAIGSWLKVPQHVCEPDQEPCNPELNTIPEACAMELKAGDRTSSMTVHSVVVEESSRIDSVIRVEDFSTLRRLLGVTARVQKFITLLKFKVKADPQHRMKTMTAVDILNAERLWIRQSQLSLVQNDSFRMWQTQFGLRMDRDGIWRCVGRLQRADLSDDTKHPIFLDKCHPLSTLIVWNCHARVMHGGVKETLTELRSKFWISRGRQFVKTVLSKCTVCKRFSSRPLSGPPPPPLPDFRVQEAPPFSFIGVDHAGPLYLRNREKVWICLFTCCLVRAVHLELVPDLTAESFIRCLRRFSARRGVPQKVVSDNSKTFRSANKILKALMNTPEVERHFLDLRIQWTFILEKEPWWGGFYERLIQSVKRCLRKAIGKARMDFDELVTVLVEVEATLNSRPISYVSSEDMEEPLTPSHLLMGRRLCSLPSPVDVSDADPEFGVTSVNLTRRMMYLNTVLGNFWKRWKTEYLVGLREVHSSGRKGAKDTVAKINLGDVVLIHDPAQPRALWRIGKVEKLLQGSDGLVRGASLRVRSGTTTIQLNRPLQLLYPLEFGSTTDQTDQCEPDQPKVIAKRSQATRAAAQVARLRMKEQLN